MNNTTKSQSNMYLQSKGYSLCMKEAKFYNFNLIKHFIKKSQIQYFRILKVEGSRTIKGMFRQNIEYFLKKPKLGMREMKYLKNTFLLFFQLSILLIFVKILAPVFTCYFWLMNNVLVIGVGGMRVYLQILMATLIFNDIWYPEQVSKIVF